MLNNWESPLTYHAHALAMSFSTSSNYTRISHYLGTHKPKNQLILSTNQFHLLLNQLYVSYDSPEPRATDTIHWWCIMAIHRTEPNRGDNNNALLVTVPRKHTHYIITSWPINHYGMQNAAVKWTAVGGGGHCAVELKECFIVAHRPVLTSLTTALHTTW